MADPYVEAYRDRMSTFGPDFWRRLDTVPSLPVDRSAELLAYVLGLACQAQHIASITLGRLSLTRIPRLWLLEHLGSAASSSLDLEDEWQFTRYVEALSFVDAAFAEEVAARALATGGPEVREAARSLAGTCADFASRYRASLTHYQLDRP
jgi:hypothetical protein